MGIGRLLVGMAVRSAARSAVRSAVRGPGPPMQRPQPPPQEPRRGGSNGCLLFIAGLIVVTGLGCGGLGMLAGIFGIVQPKQPGDVRMGITMTLTCFFVGIVPALATFAAAAWTYARRRKLDRIAALAATHGRLPLDYVAQDLGVDAAKARDLILEAVEQKLIAGRFDLEQGVFVSASAEASVGQWAGQCQRCNAHVQLALAPGQMPVCTYCGAALA